MIAANLSDRANDTAIKPMQSRNPINVSMISLPCLLRYCVSAQPSRRFFSGVPVFLACSFDTPHFFDLLRDCDR